jgi:outer membrane lipoprotein-sorting protein
MRDWLFGSILVILLVGGSSAGAGAQELSPEETVALLRSLEKSRTTAGPRKVDFREVKISPLLQEPSTLEGTLFYASPDLLRREVRSPAPSSTISNGVNLWMVYPDFQEVEVYELSRLPQVAESLQLLGEILRGRNWGRLFKIRAERVAGGYELEAIPRGAGRKQVRRIRMGLNDDLSATWVELLLNDQSSSRLEFDREKAFQPEPGFFEYVPSPDFRVSRPLG